MRGKKDRIEVESAASQEIQKLQQQILRQNDMLNEIESEKKEVIQLFDLQEKTFDAERASLEKSSAAANWKLKDIVLPAVSFAVGAYSVMEQYGAEESWPRMT